MSIPKAVQWLGDQIGDGLRAVGDVAGDALRSVGKGIQKLGDFAGDTIRAIAKDPLPTLLSYAGTFIGIPPYVTSSVITAAKGGNLEDVAKSAAISYATTSFMSDTQIGADIKNYTTNQWAGDFTDSMMEKFDLSADQAVQISKVASSSLNSSLIGGINAALSGKSIATGISSGFTSGLIYSSTDSYFDSIKKNPNWGLSPVTVDLMKGATSTALNTIVSGKGDPAQAVGNYIAYASLNMAGSSLFNKAKETYQSLTKNTEATEKAQAKYAAEKTEYDKQLKAAEDLRKSVSADTASYQKTINEQYKPFKRQYDGLIAENDGQAYAFNKYKQEFGYHKQSAENWNSYYDMPQQYFIDAANAAADKANAAAAKSKEIQDAATKLYNDNKPMLDSLPEKAAEIEKKIADFNVIKDDIEIPKDGNLAERLQDASSEYQNKYDLWAAAKSEADKSAEDYTKALAEVATRDATIDAINSGAITATKQDEDGNWVLSNNMVLTKDGKFVQDGVQQFTNAAGINQKPLDLTSADGSKIDFSEDAGRLLSTSDVKNLAQRDYGLSITDEEAKKFAGKDYTEEAIPELESFAATKAQEAGFPDYKAYQEFGGNLDAYKASIFKPADTTMAGGVQTADASGGASSFMARTGTKTFADGTVYDYYTGLFKMPDGSLRDRFYNLYELSNDRVRFVGLEVEGRPMRIEITGGSPDEAPDGVDSSGQEILPPKKPSDFEDNSDPNTASSGPASSGDAFDTALANATPAGGTAAGGTPAGDTAANDLESGEATFTDNSYQPINFDNTGTVLAINANGTALVQNDTTGAQSIAQTIGDATVGAKVDLVVSDLTGEATAVAQTGTSETTNTTGASTGAASDTAATGDIDGTITDATGATGAATGTVLATDNNGISLIQDDTTGAQSIVQTIGDVEVGSKVDLNVSTENGETIAVAKTGTSDATGATDSITGTSTGLTDTTGAATGTTGATTGATETATGTATGATTGAMEAVADTGNTTVATNAPTGTTEADTGTTGATGTTTGATTETNATTTGDTTGATTGTVLATDNSGTSLVKNDTTGADSVVKIIGDVDVGSKVDLSVDTATGETIAVVKTGTDETLGTAGTKTTDSSAGSTTDIDTGKVTDAGANTGTTAIDSAGATSSTDAATDAATGANTGISTETAGTATGTTTGDANEAVVTTGTGATTGATDNTGSNTVVATGTGTDVGTGANTGTGTGTGNSTGEGTGEGAGSGSGAGTGSSAGAGNGTQDSIDSLRKQLADKIKQDEDNRLAAEEAKRVADAAAEEEKKAAAAAALAKDIAAKQAAGRASTQAQQRAAGQGALSLLQPAATSSSDLASVAGPLAAKYLMAKEDPNKFESPLEKFLKTQNQSFGKENQYGIQPQGNVMNDPSYSYGTQRPIEDILGMGSAQSTQAGQAPDASMPSYPTAVNYAQGGMAGTRHGKYAQGGLSTPLMASGGKMRVDFRHGDAVTGAGDGQSDDIPAMLADGEFVFPADVVAAIGNGSTKAGSDKLYDMMHGIRAHARSAKPKDLPPQIKSPLDFLKRS